MSSCCIFGGKCPYFFKENELSYNTMAWWCKGKVKVMWIYIASSRETSKSLRHGSHSFTCKQHHACLYLVRVHHTALPLTCDKLLSKCSEWSIYYRPRKDERLSWPSWLTYSRRFTDISGQWSPVSCRSNAGQEKLAGQRSRGRRFDSRSFHYHVTTLGKLFTYICASVTKQYNLTLAKGRWSAAAWNVTAGLTESIARVYDWNHMPSDWAQLQRLYQVWEYIYLFRLHR